MKICFYNMNHIGDIYFMSLFLNIICQQNKDINFLYYTINGDIFLKNIHNLSRINFIEDNYLNKLINGYPPENLLDNYALTFLLNNRMEYVNLRVLKFMEDDILFVNTWCIPLNHGEFDIISAISGYSNIISTINNNYSFKLNFKINNPTELLSKNELINNNYNLVSKTFDNLEDTLFIFNFNPRSLPYNMEKLNIVIYNLSKDNKIILSSYNHLFDCNKNIKFVDKDFGIIPVPSCKNLLETWDIAIKCKKILILPTGGSWTFLHKVNFIKNQQIFMFDDTRYIKTINDFINTLLGEEKNLLQLFILQV